MKLYLAGPMRGYPQFNFPAFIAAAEDLRARGYEVLSPAEADIAEGFNPIQSEADAASTVSPEKYEALMKRDFTMIDQCDGVCLLPGWHKSEGATRERQYAEAHGKGVRVYAPSTVWGIIECDPAEVRVTDPKTGGAKGQKMARFDLLPWDQLWHVAELYGRGAQKYEERNWERGYKWSLSYAAAMRHMVQFWGREDRDAETGAHHLASAIFHMLALMRFGDSNQANDDRPRLTTDTDCH